MQQSQLHKIYDDNFYMAQASGSYLSAKEILPQVKELFGEVQSVIDVGCGMGTWLRVWSEIIPDIKIFGIDGNAADSNLYHIPLESYKEVNLNCDAPFLMQKILEKCNISTGGGGKRHFL